MNNMILAAAISLILGLILTPILIPFLRRLKFGQTILEDGPSWHRVKNGTPTMGGFAFIVSASIASLVVMFLSKTPCYQVLIPLLTAFGFGLVGFIDDYIKVVKKQNLGLSAKHKFLAQIFVSVVSTVCMKVFGCITGELVIPFLSDTIDIGFWILPLSVLVQLSVVNSVNLTDGLDGLAASISLIVCTFFAVCALAFPTGGGIFIAAVAGGCIAFLFFNTNPAKVFMGDTGAQYLGGAIAAIASMMNMPLILIIVGGVFLIETLSVILQVASFKLTGKRIFKMAPIHHHFEKCGLKEKAIVLLFSTATLILCIIGFLAVRGL